MKKLLSILLAVLVMLTSSVMTVYADEFDNFAVDIFSSDGKITLSWEKINEAESYEVFINSNVEYHIVRETVSGTSYVWIPDSYITPSTVFSIIVSAYDNNGSLVAESNTLDVIVMPVNCDYWGIYGDIDEDRMPSIVDATLIQKYLSKAYHFTRYQEKKADADNDSVVTIVDATCVQLFCAGLYAEGNVTGESFWFGTLEFDVTVNYDS